MSYDPVFGKISSVWRSDLLGITYTYDPITSLLIDKKVYDKNQKLIRGTKFQYDNVGRILQKTFIKYNDSGSASESDNFC